MTERPSDGNLPLRSRPWVLGAVVLALTLVLNIIFF